jgi:hypothetical protein
MKQEEFEKQKNEMTVWTTSIGMIGEVKTVKFSNPNRWVTAYKQACWDHFKELDIGIELDSAIKNHDDWVKHYEWCYLASW